MFEPIKQCLTQLESLVRDLDPEQLEKHQALEALECFAKIEKIGAARKALCANRDMRKAVSSTQRRIRRGK